MDKKKLFTKIMAGLLLAMMIIPTFGTLLFYVIALFGMLIGMSACKTEHTHNIVSYEEKEPTCEVSGKKEHWYCTDCGTYFIDEEGKNTIAYEDLIIDQTEHIDENNDYLCDYDCGEVLLTKESLQQTIENTFISKIYNTI